MNKKEFLEKLVRPVIDKIKEEGLIVEINKIWEDSWVDFTKEFQMYFATELIPIFMSFTLNKCENLSQEDKDIVTMLANIATKLSDKHFEE